MKRLYFLLAVFLTSFSVGAQNLIAPGKTGAGFIIGGSLPLAIYFDAMDELLIGKAAMLLQTDIEMVTGKKPVLINDLGSAPKNIIIIGTLNSSAVKKLIAAGKINVAGFKGKWEAFKIQTLRTPLKGVDNALVIIGSDRRGTAHGVFELSKQIGVSPWYWWADVPPKKSREIYIKANTLFTDAPKVRYRGIFINDEAPALSGWTKEKFGGFNHLFYEKAFELILRLKGNYLWPAMWGNAFYDDDSLNRKSADTYGVVIGTSHHEPLMRAHDEWRRFGKGKWNYDSNATELQQFWKEGMQRATNEKIVSVGMRGDGDMPMTQGTAISLLEKIVTDQRKIIEEVTKKPASQTPQLWALYKEVQDYYDKGMRVPDDVTLLLCDDNWGNIRKLPKLTDRPRKGGYGIYYHFDYVGGPRNYKWINTNNIARVWEQMHLAYEYGVKDIWIVNVGDIKPMEFPISFFLDYAYNPDKWNEDNQRSYYTQWAGEQFGPQYAKEIGEMLRKYSQYASRRKPELLDANTYEFTEYFEAQRVIEQWKELVDEVEKMNASLPAEYRDAFFQLLLHPAKAFSNLHEMYFAVAQNRHYAPLKYSLVNELAEKTKQRYIDDSLLSIQYHSIAGGKWNYMMSQTHIGYTYWQQPPVNKMPAIQEIPKNEEVPTPRFGVTDVWISKVPDNIKGNVFFEQEGFVSMNAANWTRANGAKNIRWKIVPDIGKDSDGVTTFPVTVATSLSASGPRLEFDFYTNSKDSLKLYTYFSPTLNFHNSPNGLQFAVSIDNEPPQIVSLNKEDNTGVWNTWVANNIIIKTTKHFIVQSGKHTVRYWMIDPGIILQKLVADFGSARPAYLGPPETLFKK